MRVPYRPPVDKKLMQQWRCPESVIKTIQAKSDAAYSGIETEIVLEEKGYILKAYRDGKYIGGLKDI